MIVGNWWQGEGPDVQSQWKNQEVWPKNFAVLPAAFRQVTARRFWKLYPSGPGSQACMQNALLFSFICPADKYSSHLKKQHPQAWTNPESERLHMDSLLSRELRHCLHFYLAEFKEKTAM